MQSVRNNRKVKPPCSEIQGTKFSTMFYESSLHRNYCQCIPSYSKKEHKFQVCENNLLMRPLVSTVFNQYLLHTNY